MKIALIGDMHLSNKMPVNRIDSDYLATCIGKLKFCVDMARDKDCSIILQAGDLTENPFASYRVTASIIDAIGDSQLNCVYGQHDIIGHSAGSVEVCPLAVLMASGCVNLLGATGTVIQDKVRLYGASYGISIPELPTDSDHYINILVMHASVGINKVSEHIAVSHPSEFQKRVSAYDYVLVGDFHYGFVYQQDNLCELLSSGNTAFRFSGKSTPIINMGCLLRRNKTDIVQNLIPNMGVLDIENKTLEIYEVPHKPIEEIFNLASFDETNRTDIQTITQKILDITHDWQSHEGLKPQLLRILDACECNQNTRNIIETAIVKIGGI